MLSKILINILLKVNKWQEILKKFSWNLNQDIGNRKRYSYGKLRSTVSYSYNSLKVNIFISYQEKLKT